MDHQRDEQVPHPHEGEVDEVQDDRRDGGGTPPEHHTAGQGDPGESTGPGLSEAEAAVDTSEPGGSGDDDGTDDADRGGEQWTRRRTFRRLAILARTWIDDWASAFAALDKANAQGSTSDEDEQRQPAGDNQSVDSSAQGADHGADSGQSVPGGGDDSTGTTVDVGADAGDDSRADESGSGSVFDGGEALTGQDYIDAVAEELTRPVMNKVNQEFRQRGEHVNSDGLLGWSINDKEIRKTDDDGMVTYVNPETGREFTGDDPRRAAQEWVDYRNRQMQQRFNAACEKERNEQLQAYAPQFNLLEFAPKYDAMDPVRQKLFDAMIEDYEVTDDNGNVIGYTCDLNRMQAAMERQITTLQAMGSSQQSAQPQATGPALDMHADNSVTSGNEEAPKSLAEAMQRLQDKQLNDYRSKHDRR